MRPTASLIGRHDLSSEIRKPNHCLGCRHKGDREMCVGQTRQRMTNRTNPFLSPLAALALLLMLLAACGPTAPAHLSWLLPRLILVTSQRP